MCGSLLEPVRARFLVLLSRRAAGRRALARGLHSPVRTFKKLERVLQSVLMKGIDDDSRLQLVHTKRSKAAHHA